MTVEEELISFLEKRITQENKERDVNVIACYYGFRGLTLPTYKQIAKIYEAGTTRQRVEQIIKTSFKGSPDLQSFPSLIECREILETYPAISSRDYVQLLKSARLIGDSGSTSGLIKLMHDLDICHNYDVYTPKLSKVTTHNVDQYNESYVIEKNSLKEIREKRNKAKTLPGQVGLASFTDFVKECAVLDREKEVVLKSIIVNSPDTWCSTDEPLWYIFEDRNNSIFNSSGKIFSILDKCNVHILAEACKRAFRGSIKAQPAVEVIETYLRRPNNEKSLFRINDEMVEFLGDKTKLKPLEEDARLFLQDKNFVYRSELRRFLLEKHGKAHRADIDGVIAKSPIIRVDRTLGKHRFTLISNALVITGAHNATIIRNELEKRLKKVITDGTDIPVESIGRKEQRYLRYGIFGNSTHQECAICHQRYLKSALVAAHKRKRANCKDEERGDLNIVMPLCLFGCDYLYENGFIYVENGVVKINSAKESHDREYSLAKARAGNALKARWLEGSEAYFDKHREEIT